MRKSIFGLAVMVLLAAAVMAGDSTTVDVKANPDTSGQIKKAVEDSAKAGVKAVPETPGQVKKAIEDSAKAGVKAVPETPGQVKKTIEDSAKAGAKAIPETPGQTKKGSSDSTKVEGKGKAETPGQLKKETGEKPAEGKAGAQKGTDAKMPVQKSGFQIIDKVIGTGELATKGDMVEVHYTGWLWENGKKGAQFDSSRDKGTPFSVKIGIGKVIKGWDEGIPGMKVGGTRELIIPPAMAYGARSIPGRIPPNSTLMFEIELLKVTKGQ